MNSFVLIGVAIGLSLDAFAISIATSIILKDVSARQVFRLAFHFGLFQAFMPIIGWFAGQSIQQYISFLDHWIAFAILGFIGAKAIVGENRDTKISISDPTRGVNLIMLSLATSIDALATGLSFAFLDVSIWCASLLIGIFTAVITAFGMIFGRYLGERFGKRVEVIGGVILICIGLSILVQHLVSQ